MKNFTGLVNIVQHVLVLTDIFFNAHSDSDNPDLTIFNNFLFLSDLETNQSSNLTLMLMM